MICYSRTWVWWCAAGQPSHSHLVKIIFPWLLGLAEQAPHLSHFHQPSTFTPNPMGGQPPPHPHPRNPSSKGTHARAPGSTNRHTHCACMVPPPSPIFVGMTASAVSAGAFRGLDAEGSKWQYGAVGQLFHMHPQKCAFPSPPWVAANAVDQQKQVTQKNGPEKAGVGGGGGGGGGDWG